MTDESKKEPWTKEELIEAIANATDLDSLMKVEQYARSVGYSETGLMIQRIFTRRQEIIDG